MFVIDVAGGDDIPRKRGPGVLRCDLLVVNKVDLAPYVGVDLEPMLADASRVRGGRPVIASNACSGAGRQEDRRWILAAVLSPRHAAGGRSLAGGRTCPGGRTILRRQSSGAIPLHVTRAFYLHRPRSDLATLYLQSLWRSAEARSGCGAYAARNPTHTRVYGRSPRPRRRFRKQRQMIKVKDGAFLRRHHRPLCAVPRACLSLKSSIEVAADGVLDPWPKDLRFTIRCRMVAVSIRFSSGTLVLRPNHADCFPKPAISAVRLLGSGSARLAA